MSDWVVLVSMGVLGALLLAGSLAPVLMLAI